MKLEVKFNRKWEIDDNDECPEALADLTVNMLNTLVNTADRGDGIQFITEPISRGMVCMVNTHGGVGEKLTLHEELFKSLIQVYAVMDNATNDESLEKLVRKVMKSAKN